MIILCDSYYHSLFSEPEMFYWLRHCIQYSILTITIIVNIYHFQIFFSLVVSLDFYLDFKVLFAYDVQPEKIEDSLLVRFALKCNGLSNFISSNEFSISSSPNGYTVCLLILQLQGDICWREFLHFILKRNCQSFPKGLKL